MNPMNPARRILAAALLCAIAAAPLVAAAQAGPKPVPAANACVSKLKGTAPMKVKLTTSMGAFTVELNKEKAPVSAENFAKYVDSGHYNGTIFHRVIDGFMIQGGGFTKDMQQKAVLAPIKNEAANGLKNEVYTLAMARTGVRDSATAQFFINVGDNDFLDFKSPGGQGWGYCVFGKVVAGQDIVDRIKGVPTGTSGFHQDVPREDVVIKSVEEVAG